MPDPSFNNEFALTTFIKLFNYGYSLQLYSRHIAQ